jgi:hypothetical protein
MIGGFMYYLFLLICGYYTINYLNTRTVAQMIMDGFSIICNLICGLIFVIGLIVWLGHN